MYESEITLKKKCEREGEWVDGCVTIPWLCILTTINGIETVIIVQYSIVVVLLFFGGRGSSNTSNQLLLFPLWEIFWIVATTFFHN